MPPYADEVEHETAPDAVEIVIDDELLYLRGDVATVDRIVNGLFGPPEARAGVANTSTAMAAVGAGAIALGATHETCFRLTARGKELMDTYGLQPAGGEAFWGFVRGDRGFAGNLTFKKVSLGAEQALALQTAAVSLALRTAIADVKSAVEKVDRKVTDIQHKLGAREIGEIVGSHSALRRIVAATDRRGRLLEADWDGVAGVGHDLERAIAALRAYVTLSIGDLARAGSLPKRADSLAAFARPEGVAGALRLLSVAEDALHLWEYLRIQRVRTTDPEHVESALQDSRELLKQQRAANRELIEAAIAGVETARTVGPLEIHHILGYRSMQRASEAALRELVAFAARAQVEVPAVDLGLARPSVTEARAELSQNLKTIGQQTTMVAKDAGRAAKKAAAELPRQVRRSSDEETPSTAPSKQTDDGTR